jgi:thiol-disulfide isomerase/thioredoxin
MRRFALLINSMVIVLIMADISPTVGFPAQSDDFEFTLADGSLAMLSDFQDKPILLDWSASWCPSCDVNKRTIDSLYNDFVNFTNFITISYGGSGDTLAKVNQEKGDYPWTFALDHTNYAGDAGANNADIWILDQNFTLRYSWDYSEVPKLVLAEKLNDVIGIVTSETTSEVTSTSTTTIITDDSTITSETVIISNTTITSLASIDLNTIEDEILPVGLFENPLFVGFVVLSVGGIIFVQIAKRR